MCHFEHGCCVTTVGLEIFKYPGPTSQSHVTCKGFKTRHESYTLDCMKPVLNTEESLTVTMTRTSYIFGSSFVSTSISSSQPCCILGVTGDSRMLCPPCNRCNHKTHLEIEYTRLLVVENNRFALMQHRKRLLLCAHPNMVSRLFTRS